MLVTRLPSPRGQQACLSPAEGRGQNSSSIRYPFQFKQEVNFQNEGPRTPQQGSRDSDLFHFIPKQIGWAGGQKFSRKNDGYRPDITARRRSGLDSARVRPLVTAQQLDELIFSRQADCGDECRSAVQPLFLQNRSRRVGQNRDSPGGSSSQPLARSFVTP